MRKNQLKIQKSRLSWQLLMRYIASLALFLVLLPLAGALLIVIVMPLWRSRGLGRDGIFMDPERMGDELSSAIYYSGCDGGLAGDFVVFYQQAAAVSGRSGGGGAPAFHPGEEPVVLPAALAETENELNLARERAIRDAYAAKEAEQRKNDLIVYLAHDSKNAADERDRLSEPFAG